MKENSVPLISLPVGVLTKQSFRHQASLFWFVQQQVYGVDAAARTTILWVENNLEGEPRETDRTWLDNLGAPYVVAPPYYEVFDCASHGVNVPLNIQAALVHVIDDYHPDQLIEVLDCDMLHLRKAPDFDVAANEILVDPIYEPWHLHSKGKHRDIVAGYLEHGDKYFNGGFVPIIGRAGTIKKILQRWIEVHIHIVNRDLPDKIKWWAGMYALQVACDNAQVTMKGLDTTYIPGKNQLLQEHHIAHYSVDKIFNKKTPEWPFVDPDGFPKNTYYEHIRAWLEKQNAPNTKSTVLEDRWKHWIAKCLMMEHSTESIVSNLITKGYSSELIHAEIEIAKKNPYLRGAQDVYRREKAKLENVDFENHKALNNQQWLLKTYEKLAAMDNKFGHIARITAPPFNEFVSRYVSQNRPVIIQGAMKDWPAYLKWDLDYFEAMHGDAVVSIQDGREADPYYERNQKFYRSDCRLSDFIARLRATQSSNDFYMTAGNMGQHREHLPKIFADSDGVNIGDGYLKGAPEGSLWVGPQGTVTPLHFDMVNNLFCQIRGRKRVRLVPSWSLPWVYNDYHVYSDVDAAQPNFLNHPLFENATMFDFVVNPGEILFIPIGWWHHLVSLDVSISLTRKNLALPEGNSFGSGFIKESRNFRVGIVEKNQ
ncbi:MAG: cupin-like domain-containing protein [Pseudohongiellaceae bacterium]